MNINRKYTITSSADAPVFEPFTVTVDDDGIVTADTTNNGLYIGSKFDSLVNFWKGFEGENGYTVTEA